MGSQRHEDAAGLLRRHGARALTDAQLLAILLARDGLLTGRADSLGRRLLERFGHPSRLGRAGMGELVAVPGLGAAGASRLSAAMELGRRTMAPPTDRPRLTSSREVAEWFIPRLASREVEHFCCALLDTRNRLIREVTVGTGTVNACFIHPREVFRTAIAESACAVVLAHNHPSGELRPSDEDISLTKRVSEAGSVVGIRVLDHVIVGPGGFFSFLDAGLMGT